MRRFWVYIIFLSLSSTCVMLSCGRNDNARVYYSLFIDTDNCQNEDSGYTVEDSTFIEFQENVVLLVIDIPNSRSSQILKRKGYVVSYNHKKLCSNWVAWHLTREHTDGPFTRKGVPYFADDGTVYGVGHVTSETCKNSYFVDLEAEEPRQQLADWTRDYNMSHGHMCPAGDNKWDKAAMNQSFLLTNMCPQDEKLNGGGWKKLEEKCRSWANQYGEIYIVAGPIFNEPITRTMGKGKIAIPDAFFKVILCLQGTPKAIGFVYNNDSSSQVMKDRIRSVDEIETITGFDFFSSLPDDVEEEVESRADLRQW